MAEEHQKVVEEHRKMAEEQYAPIFHSNSQFENSPDFASG